MRKNYISWKKNKQTGKLLEVESFFSVLIFSDQFFIFFFHLTEVSVSTGRMRWYMHPKAQILQFLHDATSIYCQKVCCVSQLSLKSVEEISGDRDLLYSARLGHRRSLTPQEDSFFALGGKEWAFSEPFTINPIRPPVSLTKQSEMSRGWSEGPTSSSESCDPWLAPWSLIGIFHRIPELAGTPEAPCAVHRWQQVHPEHMSHVTGRCAAFSVWPGWWWVSDSPGRHTQKSPGHRTLSAVRYRDYVECSFGF